MFTRKKWAKIVRKRNRRAKTFFSTKIEYPKLHFIKAIFEGHEEIYFGSSDSGMLIGV